MSGIEDDRLIVIKIGSALVADTDGAPRKDWLRDLAGDIAQLRQAGRQVILVSSGAIALGRIHLSAPPRRLDEKQAAAAIGQPILMSVLTDAFAAHNIRIAQALLTLDDTEDRRRWLNARATLSTLLEAGIVPVINENDTIATDEIRYGDNDRLAARVAQMVGADTLALISDVDGLYTGDPRTDASAVHIPVVTDITPEIIAMGSGPNAAARVGSGGMATKISAAQIAWEAGCKTVISKGENIPGEVPLALNQVVSWFVPPVSPNSARQNWLSGHLTPEGTLTVDAGAQAALVSGASLLPVGVRSVEGQFKRGAAVAVQSEAGAPLGKGVTAYSSEDIEQIKGLQSGDIEARLGYRGRPAVIHRDDLILL